MNTILYFQSPSKTSAPDKIAGVRRYAATADWHVQLVNGIPSPNALAQLTRFWGASGAIVECGGGYQDIPTEMFSVLPTVYLDRNPRSLPADASCVSHDSVATGRLAAKELLITGHPHFAFVPYPQPRFWSDDRECGFREALTLNGKSCETFVCGRHSPQSIIWQKTLRKWIVRIPKPCGIFAANDNVAAEVITSAVRSGFSIPNDIAVCGVDNFIPICEHTSPTLTSVQPDFLLAGELAARTLDEIISGRGKRAIRLTFGPANIVRRASSRTGSRYDPEVSAALELIRRNACGRLSAADVTATFKCSRRMAEMKFRRITGHSILDEIQAVRLDKIKDLLAGSNMDMTTIANFCGFKAANALWKFFRQETGKSPLQWRKEAIR
ncbi:MAG: helix-turn-helix domain-containing protein [Lentisphaerae bacterium]|nr:helix-turn-helix domain-containing protein [Lentisphaerota bacterium]